MSFDVNINYCNGGEYMEEVWKDVIGYEGAYKISNKGKVYSIPRNGTLGGIMKPTKQKNGYYFIHLKNKDKKINTGVHRLVAQAFIPNPDNKPTVNHIDGDKQNNCVENLEWATYKEQLDHSLQLGLRKSQCNIQRKAVVVLPTNEKIYFENINDLTKYFNKSRTYIHHYINKKNNKFYIKDKLILISDRNKDFIIEDYIPPTVNDIPLYYYCEINNLNYGTVRDRKRRGKTKDDMIQPTKTGFVKY